MPKRLFLLVTCVLALLVSGCDKLPSSEEPVVADVIYTGTIITFDEILPEAEAVAVDDGRIIAVGSRAEVMPLKGPSTLMRDLGERVMLPGFIDAHSHFMRAVNAGNDDVQAAIKSVQMDYARNGYTTITNGTTGWADYQQLKQAADSKDLILDVIAIADVNDLGAFQSAGTDWLSTAYHNHLRVGGVKLVLDGLPEEKQAYLTLPMLLADGPNGEKSWRGFPLYEEKALDDLIGQMVRDNIPMFAEAYGDAAIDMFIGSLGINGVSEEMDRRDTVIHATFMRPSDHVNKFKRAGVVASFCTNRIQTAGDLYKETIGGKRVEEINPFKSTYYIRATNHTDYPETTLNPMMSVWTAVNRLTAKGELFQEWQKLDVTTALRAMTIDAAWQFHEETDKGSITKGKVADFVVLDKNPLTADPMALKDIFVMETIKDGLTVFTAD